jgi:SPP1 gp7 family putative phage head morphogenesis protein
MNSKDYWAQREAEALKHRITDEREYDKEIKRIYSEMLDNIQKEIDGFYGRYATKEGISLAEAKKRVSKLDIERYERKAEKYVREKDFSDKANEEMRIYNLTMKVNRLELLKAQIGLETIAGHDALQKFLESILKGRTLDELKRQAGILGKSLGNNAKAAHAIVNGSFKVARVGNKNTFSDYIWQYQDLMRIELGKQLQIGLIQGKNPRAIARSLEKFWYGNDPLTGGGAVFCMERLMRTELARVQTEAQKQSFERNGFDMFMFIANSGCCPDCQRLNGKTFRVSKMMPGENASPLHPLCRCSIAAYEDSAEYEAWLDYLSKGGTTAEWEKLKKTGKTVAKLPEHGTMKMNLQRFAKMNKEKFTEYALNPIKAPDKAEAFKKALGYDVENYEELMQNIYEHINEEKFVEKGNNGHGMLYEYVLELTGANGKKANVLTAWIEEGDDKRLTSVYVTNKRVTE